MNPDRYFHICPLCHSKHIKALSAYAHAYLSKCSNCGLVFASKIPTVPEITSHYSNYPRGFNISPVTFERYNELLDNFESYRKTNNLLDIGCGSGHFIETAKKRGWNAFGTEISKEAVDLCNRKGLKVIKSNFSDTSFMENFFDVITCFEVIEHIQTPHALIKYSRRILRDGGALYLTTPNFNALSRIILGGKWNIIEYPEHLSYYTPRTLHKLFISHNFIRGKMETTGVSISRFRKCIINSNVSINDDPIRERIEKSCFLRTLKIIINYFLVLTEKGDTIKTLYIKANI